VSIALLDINVLISLFDPLHPHHQAAHNWLSHNRKSGWATCPITINGCIRILSNPRYPNGVPTLGDAAERLRDACSTPDHHFWPDSITLFDDSLFRLSMIGGHQKITDAYLLGLAVRNHGRLATFDQSIPTKAVPGSVPRISP
jgi:toxin-antitoxin system PIN domain toxin